MDFSEFISLTGFTNHNLRKFKTFVRFCARASLRCLLRCTGGRRQEFLVKAGQYYLNYLQTFFPDSFVAKVAAACRPKVRWWCGGPPWWCHHNECDAPPCPDQITAAYCTSPTDQVSETTKDHWLRHIGELHMSPSLMLHILQFYSQRRLVRLDGASCVADTAK